MSFKYASPDYGKLFPSFRTHSFEWKQEHVGYVSAHSEFGWLLLADRRCWIRLPAWGEPDKEPMHLVRDCTFAAQTRAAIHLVAKKQSMIFDSKFFIRDGELHVIVKNGLHSFEQHVVNLNRLCISHSYEGFVLPQDVPCSVEATIELAPPE